MRRFAVALVGLALVAAVSVAQESRPGDATSPEAKKFLAEWAARTRDVKTLRVEFTQTKTLRILRHPLVSRGVVLLKGEKLLMTVDSADGKRETELAVDASRGEVRIHYPQLARLEVFETGKGAPPETPFPFFGGDVENLPATHDVSLAHEKEGALDLDVLVLVPRDPASEAGETRMVFRKGQVARVRQTTRAGEKLELEVTKFETNVEVPDSAVELVVPAGTEVVRPLEGDGGGKK